MDSHYIAQQHYERLHTLLTSFLNTAYSDLQDLKSLRCFFGLVVILFQRWLWSISTFFLLLLGILLDTAHLPVNMVVSIYHGGIEGEDVIR